MGLGSLAAKPLLRAPLTAFLVVEVLIALLGGLSALALFAAFAWLDLYQPAMLLVAAGSACSWAARSRCSWGSCSASAARGRARASPTCSPRTTSARWWPACRFPLLLLRRSGRSTRRWPWAR
jgi:hypothetical protein